MNCQLVSKHIQTWLLDYLSSSKQSGFVVGISGGIDSAITSKLCALTGKKTILVTLPIRQTSTEFDRAIEHMEQLKKLHSNVSSIEINLSDTFSTFESCVPFDIEQNHLAMANSRSRLRMTALYAVAQANQSLVVGTGNKIEDFGIGFFTKYGDGGVDISPIADLTKTQVFKMARYLDIVEVIQKAKPTDGLFDDGRSDEDQIGASYPELEWAMNFKGEQDKLSKRQLRVLTIYKRLNSINQHKILPIPVCKIPNSYL